MVDCVWVMRGGGEGLFLPGHVEELEDGCRL